MSITGLDISDSSEKIYKKSFHRRNDSGELDVFEASRYFSGYNEPTTTTFSEKIMKEDRVSWRSVGRISLDMPMRNILSHNNQQSHQMVNENKIKEKKYKQPNSPGGKLASFLNSIFNQSSSKKKKSKSTQSMKDHEEENPSGRRRRRSSISHFRSSISTANDSKSLYSSSSSGFRTPPPYALTPTKCYKEFRSYSDHKQVFPLSKCNGNNIIRSIASSQSDDQGFDGKREKDLSWLDEKFKYSNGFSEKYKNLGNNNNNNSFSEKEFRKFDEVDDGADSDSSSDLFELQNYDVGSYSSGLPVYETTNMDSIKRGAPISNAQL